MLPYAAHVCMMESVVASTVVLGLWHPGLVLNFECFCSRVAFFFACFILAQCGQSMVQKCAYDGGG